jgi:hypothetical protein
MQQKKDDTYHELEEAADELDQIYAENIELQAEIKRLMKEICRRLVAR